MAAIADKNPFVEHEAMAFDALDKVLTLDPRDAAAAADRASLRAATGAPAAVSFADAASVVRRESEREGGSSFVVSLGESPSDARL